MAKTLVRNKIAERVFGMALPCDAKDAKAFCEAMLDGTYAIYERTTEKGNETEQAVNQVTITGESTDKRKATFSFYASANKNPDEIMSALKGKTFNSVKFDKVYIISFQQISIGAGE